MAKSRDGLSGDLVNVKGSSSQKGLLRVAVDPYPLARPFRQMLFLNGDDSPFVAGCRDFGSGLVG